MAMKKAQPVNGAMTEDIPHEVITTNKSEPLPAKIDTEAQIKLEVAKFNLADSAIAEFNKKYGKLKIKSVDDKEGYNEVKEAWNIVRSSRTGLEKKGKSLRDNYTLITKAISTEEKRLIGLLEPLEDSLYEKWKAIDAEKEKVKKEKEEEEQRQLMARLEQLTALGMTLTDGFYRIGDTISMDVATLRSLPDDKFEQLRQAVAHKAVEILKQQEEAEALERKKKEDFEREQQELKEKQQKFEEDQRKFKEQQDQLKRDQEEAAKQKLQMRINKLESMGMRSDTESVIYSNGFNRFSVPIESVENIQDWPNYLVTIEKNIEYLDGLKAAHDAEVAAEKAETERRQKFIASELEAAGMSYEYSSESFVFVNKVINISFVWNDFAGMDDKAIKGKAFWAAEAISKAKKDAEKAEADEKLAKEKEHRLAMSDQQVFDSIIEQTEAFITSTFFEIGIFKTPDFNTKANAIASRLLEILNEK